METRAFGKTGMQVGVLGFGGSEIGFGDTEQSQVDRLLNEALDAGLNVIDTAECYRDSEGKIGRAVGHRRSDYYLFTKCGHASGLEGEDWSPDLLRRSIDRSLQRLQTDCVDLVQLHTCSLDLLRQGDVIAVLQEARDAGKTRFIGYSGDQDAARYAVECGAFDSLQTSVNIADQEAIELTLPLAAERGMGVIVKRPVANVAWIRGATPGYHSTYYERLQALAYPFLEGPDAFATALRFTLAQPISTMIVGTARPGRWQENAAIATQAPLSADTIREIRARWTSVAKPEWRGQG